MDAQISSPSYACKEFGNINNSGNIMNYRAIGKRVKNSNLWIRGDMLNNLQDNIGLRAPGHTIYVYTGNYPTHSIKDFLNLRLPK